MSNKNGSSGGLYPATEVAKYLVKLGSKIVGNDEGASAGGITHLKLQKLLFFSQVYYLSGLNKPLFNDTIAAWKYGPVVPSVWKEYKHYEGNPIRLGASYLQTDLSNEDQKIIKDEIWDIFGKYSASTLVEMTHNHDPWKKAWDNGKGEGSTISKSIIKSYYKPLL